MADLSRFFPGLGGPAVAATPPADIQQGDKGEGGAPGELPSLMSGLLNPMALLSPAAATAPPAPAFDNSSDQDGKALLAMLQAPASSAAPASGDATTRAAPASSGATAGVAGLAGGSTPSTTPAKAAKAPKGVALARGQATYEVGAVGAAARKQTKVTAITIYNTDAGYRAGRLIAVSSRYICYGVRGGSVRVIHQTTGQRLLQKGHTSSELADLCISGEGDACTLAAVAANGDLFVWAISIENMTEVKATELYRRDGGSHGYSRIVWHPSLPLLACAVSGDSASVSILGGFAEGHEPTCKQTAAKHTGTISGLAWVAGGAGGTGVGVASAGSDGKVIVCDGSGAVEVSFTPYQGEAVQSVLVAQPKGQVQPLIITGSSGNTCLKLWSADASKCLHTLTFTAPGGKTAAGPELLRATVDLDPLHDFVLVANTLTGPGDRYLNPKPYTLNSKPKNPARLFARRHTLTAPGDK